MANKVGKKILIPKENLVLETNCDYHFDQKIVENFIRAIMLDEQKSDGWEININFIDNDTIRELHLEYFDDDSATDVISFHYHEKDSSKPDGEIFINIMQAEIQSKEFKVSLDNEILRLISHGLFHILGYDDSTEAEIAAMRQREDRALNFLLEP